MYGATTSPLVYAAACRLPVAMAAHVWCDDTPFVHAAAYASPLTMAAHVWCDHLPMRRARKPGFNIRTTWLP